MPSDPDPDPDPEEELDLEIGAWLALESRRPVPEPGAELIARSLRRVRGWVLLRDLVAFVTLEGVWRGLRGPQGDASENEERQAPARTDEDRG